MAGNHVKADRAFFCEVEYVLNIGWVKPTGTPRFGEMVGSTHPTRIIFMEKKYLLKNEKGFVLVVALVLLGLLSLLGVAVTNTSRIEVQIAANNRAYTQNFYLADSAAREGIAFLNKNVTSKEQWESDYVSNFRWAAVSSEFRGETSDLTNSPIKVNQNNIDEIKAWLTAPGEWNNLKEAEKLKASGHPLAPFVRYAIVGPISSGGGGSMRATGGASMSTVGFIVYGIYDNQNPDDANRGQVLVDVGYELTIFTGTP